MSEFINVETLAVDSAQTTNNSIDFKADLTMLDMVFADGALIKFLYSDTLDGGALLDPQHQHETDRGLFDLGQISSQITGLNADTEYHYKAVGETVTYNSPVSIANAADSGGFMSDVADNFSEIDKVTDSATAMDKVLDSIVGRTKMLLSPHIIDTMWSKEMAAGKFWDVVYAYGSDVSGTDNHPPFGVAYGDNEWDDSRSSGSGTNIHTTLNDGKYALEIEVIDSDDPYERGFAFKVNLDDINTLKSEMKIIGVPSSWPSHGIKIAGTGVEFETSQQETNWITRELDVSTLTGEHEVYYYTNLADYTGGDWRVLFSNIKLEG